MKLIHASDSSLLVVFGDTISGDLHGRVLALFAALQRRCDPYVRNLHPAYASLLVDFDPLRITHQELSEQLRVLAEAPLATPALRAEAITIPVCYDAEFGPDLAEVAAHAGLGVEEVIRLHSSATYFVYFLGFSPGFAYLGGLPEQLRVPRLPNPRRLVAAGTVAIAGDQAGVYPLDSPGGWRLLGRTPIRMFSPACDPPTRLQLGDRVKFASITRSEFLAQQDREAI